MTLDEIAERLPPPLVPSAAADAAAANADTGAPLAQVFVREVALANALLELVTHDMRRLELVLARHTRVSRDLEAVIDAFCNDKVPMAWRTPSLTPAATPAQCAQRTCALRTWLAHQLRHAQALARWCASGEVPPSRSGSDAESVWLPGLMCPASLVEATRLRAAIANKWPLAQTRIVARVQGVPASSQQVPNGSDESAGVCVSGVQLDQACWDVGRMGAVRGDAGGCGLPPVVLTGVGQDAAALVAPTLGHGGEAVDEWLGVPRPRRGASASGFVASEGATSGAGCVSVPVLRTLGRAGPAVMHVAIPALDQGSTAPREWLLAAVCGVLDPC